MSSSGNYELFLSHQWDSKKEVELLYKFLTEENGFRVWKDKNSLQSGDNLSDQIADAISNAKLFVCCITRAYAQSPMCNNEINFAIALKKPIIPLMFEKVSIAELKGVGFLISSLLRVNLYEDPNIFSKWEGDVATEIVKTINIKLCNLQHQNYMVDEGTFLWKKEGFDQFFYKSHGDIWFEKQEYTIFASYKFVKKNKNGDIILFDESRNVFVKLTHNTSFWGDTENKIDNFICNGSWYDRNKLSEDDTKLAWKTSDNDQCYFYRQSQCGCFFWTEKQEDTVFATFKEIDRNENEVVLFDETRQIYIKLKDDRILWGSESNEISNLLNYGGWLKTYILQ